jgi:hypothetical protein
VKPIKRIMLACFVAVLICTSCATPPEDAPAFTPTALGMPDEHRAVLIIYRKIVPPTAYTVTATVDDRLFAKLPNKAFSWIYLTPGEHVLKIAWPALALQHDEERTLNVDAGKYYFVQFEGDMRVFFGIPYTASNVDLVDSEQAIRALRECCRFVPSPFHESAEP